VELYRGDFLAQFVQSGSEAFEEWALIQRERLHREVLDALHHLTQHFEWRGDYAQALRFAQRQLELDPWREEATGRRCARCFDRTRTPRWSHDLCRRGAGVGGRTQ
jgi:DNA-binding SARP family transcriptional activator